MKSRKPVKRSRKCPRGIRKSDGKCKRKPGPKRSRKSKKPVKRSKKCTYGVRKSDGKCKRKPGPKRTTRKSTSKTKKSRKPTKKSKKTKKTKTVTPKSKSWEELLLEGKEKEAYRVWWDNNPNVGKGYVHPGFLANSEKEWKAAKAAVLKKNLKFKFTEPVFQYFEDIKKYENVFRKGNIIVWVTDEETDKKEEGIVQRVEFDDKKTIDGGLLVNIDTYDGGNFDVTLFQKGKHYEVQYWDDDTRTEKSGRLIGNVTRSFPFREGDFIRWKYDGDEEEGKIVEIKSIIEGKVLIRDPSDSSEYPARLFKKGKHYKIEYGDNDDLKTYTIIQSKNLKFKFEKTEFPIGNHIAWLIDSEVVEQRAIIIDNNNINNNILTIREINDNNSYGGTVEVTLDQTPTGAYNIIKPEDKKGTIYYNITPRTYF